MRSTANAEVVKVSFSAGKEPVKVVTTPSSETLPQALVLSFTGITRRPSAPSAFHVSLRAYCPTVYVTWHVVRRDPNMDFRCGGNTITMVIELYLLGVPGLVAVFNSGIHAAKLRAP